MDFGYGARSANSLNYNSSVDESKRHSHWIGVSGPSALGGSTQSYAFMCIFPRRSLLKTVIPGWLWRGITAFAGRKKIHSCTEKHDKKTDQQLKHKFYFLKLFYVLYKNKYAGPTHVRTLKICWLFRLYALVGTC